MEKGGERQGRYGTDEKGLAKISQEPFTKIISHKGKQEIINHYCSHPNCKKSTRHVMVRMENRTYYYCTTGCGYRLETREEYDASKRQIK